MTTTAEALALAVQYHQRGDLPRAEQIYRQILQADPQNVGALHLLGLIARQAGRNDVAIDYISRAVRLRPEFAEAHSNLGVALMEQGRLEEALASHREAVRLKPDYAAAHNNLGIALKELGRPEEAAACYRRALALEPNYAEAHNNLAVALKELGRLDEAAACYQQALALKPGYAEAHNNLGNLLREQGRPDEAVAAYEQAVRHRPAYADAHRNLGLARLFLGDFEAGWPEHEWRWQCKETVPPPSSRPRWDGSDPAGRTVLLFAQQGLGDTLQFVRYAPLVKRRGATAIVACQPPLLGLLATCPGIDRLVPLGSELPPFDVQAGLLSLPGLFGTCLATIPAEVPYLSADTARVERWRRELGGLRGLKVGIAWQGNPAHKGDWRRSVPLARFAPLARLEGVQLFSLQKGHGTEQLAAVANAYSVIDLGGRLDDFADTAAVLANLDLVVTVDTALAHLAGALGVPAWVALPFAPDWRWLLGRDDSPWYPTLRLFRQPRSGDWDDVFQRLAGELGKAAATAGPPGRA